MTSRKEKQELEFLELQTSETCLQLFGEICETVVRKQLESKEAMKAGFITELHRSTVQAQVAQT